jgi:hypothetical protein
MTASRQQKLAAQPTTLLMLSSHASALYQLI